MTPPTFNADIICDTWFSSGVFITPATGEEPTDAAVLRPAMPLAAGLLNIDKIDAADACETPARRTRVGKGIWGWQRGGRGGEEEAAAGVKPTERGNTAQSTRDDSSGVYLLQLQQPRSAIIQTITAV